HPARLRAARNKPYAVGGPYLRVNASARNKGLCPHLKYHAFHAWMFIHRAKDAKKPVKSRKKPGKRQFFLQKWAFILLRLVL
ncbi:MAG: hypothetical protein IKK98_01450, partial [Oscillospiraceae bacterium]|nr:hypothetical protein [Oscillospiraceae bacterium]